MESQGAKTESLTSKGSSSVSLFRLHSQRFNGMRKRKKKLNNYLCGINESTIKGYIYLQY